MRGTHVAMVIDTIMLSGLRLRFVFTCLLAVAVPTAIAACAAPVATDDASFTGSKPKPKPKPDKNKPSAGQTETPAGPSAPPPPAAPQGDQPPTLTTIAPAAAAIGSAPNGVDVTLTGTRFIAGSQVDIAGTKIAATFDSATQLKVKIPADKLNAAGMLRLVVETKPGVQSNSLSFTVANPTNTSITNINPNNVVLGQNQAVTLAVVGTGFTQGSVVKFNGAQLATTFTSATALSAAIPAATFIDAGRFSVTVSSGAGDVVSLPVSFEVRNPAPSSTTISPSSVAAGSAAVSVTIDGNGFTKGSTVLSGASSLATTFVSEQRLRATVPSNLIATSGTRLSLTVQNGAPGGGSSNAQTLTVTAAANNGGTSGGTTSGGTTTTKPNCAYLCSDYGYKPGECFQDWYCIDSGTYAGCLGQTACGNVGGNTGGGNTGGGTGLTCEYDCKTYGYAPGECWEDYYCSSTTGCLEAAYCGF